jgi:surface antigen Omp85-like protein
MRPRFLILTILLAGTAWAAEPENDPTQAPAQGPIAPPPAAQSKGLSRWFNPATAPFIPVPEIAVDPDSGTTLGLIPTWIQTDENHEIRRIIAPDVLYNPYFGYGVHGRIYGYTSEDEQWSTVAGIKERVEREFDFEYQRGRLREERWSFNTSVIYDRDGTPRFYGIGNESPAIAETNYTNQKEEIQQQVGLNLTHAWQILYTARFLDVDVLPGTLAKVASIQTRFARTLGIGTNKQVVNRLAVVYDTRDNLVVPSRGIELIAYGGLASRNGLMDDSMYSEVGGDGRAFWPIQPDTILVGHMAIRYMPTSHAVPFWALSSIGGGESVVGGEQPLRGFGEGRFYDRDSFSSSLELRHKVFSFDATTTSVDVEVTPFIDVGRVFSRTSTLPFDQLHHVYGLGFRGIARPFVVGYVDIGYGSEGIAAFTGLNYPF